MRRVRAVLLDQSMHTLDFAGPTRDHGKLSLEALEIQLADNAVDDPVCTRKHPRAELELLTHELNSRSVRPKPSI